MSIISRSLTLYQRVATLGSIPSTLPTPTPILQTFAYARYQSSITPSDKGPDAKGKPTMFSRARSLLSSTFGKLTGIPQPQSESESQSKESLSTTDEAEQQMRRQVMRLQLAMLHNSEIRTVDANVYLDILRGMIKVYKLDSALKKGDKDAKAIKEQEVFLAGLSPLYKKHPELLDDHVINQYCDKLQVAESNAREVLAATFQWRKINLMMKDRMDKGLPLPRNNRELSIILQDIQCVATKKYYEDEKWWEEAATIDKGIYLGMWKTKRRRYFRDY